MKDKEKLRSMFKVMYDIDVKDLNFYDIDGHHIGIHYIAPLSGRCAARVFVIIDDKAWDLAHIAIDCADDEKNHGTGPWYLAVTKDLARCPEGFGLEEINLTNKALALAIPHGCCGKCYNKA